MDTINYDGDTLDLQSCWLSEILSLVKWTMPPSSSCLDINKGKQEAQVQREVACWTDQWLATLQDFTALLTSAYLQK